MKRLSAKDKRLLAAETDRAEKYLVERLRMTGELHHVPDGKQDVLLQLPYPALIQLMRDYAINRMADLCEEGKVSPT